MEVIISTINIHNMTDITSRTVFHKKVLLKKNLTVKKDTHLKRDATIGDDLEVYGLTRLHGRTDIDSVLHVVGDVTLDSNLRVAGTTLSQGDVTMESNLLVEGTVLNTDVTQSTSSTTGAIVTSGGVGIGRDLQVGGNIYQAGYLLLPPGCVFPYGGSSSPAGYLLCDGASYSTTTYASLFAIIGYTYGGSSGNFNVPDMRGRFPLGTSVSHNLGTSSGAETQTLTSASQIPSHTHSITGISNTGTYAYAAGSDTHLVPGGSTATDATGGTDSFSIMNPYLSLQYIIKY